MSSVFISYSSKDKGFAQRLALDLKKHGIKVWLDEWRIKVGDEIRQEKEHGIEEFEYFVIILSRHSVKWTPLSRQKLIKVKLLLLI